jgi:hypothetical protein
VAAILIATHKPAELAIFAGRTNYAVSIPMAATPYALAASIVLYLALGYIASVAY